MFRNILVGVDGSASADRALRRAVEIAEANRGRLGLLSVAPRIGIWASVAPFGLPISRTQMDAELEAWAQRHLDRAEHAVPRDVPVTKLLARGRPAPAFIAHALGGAWDLIVIGRRRRSVPWPAAFRLEERLVRSSPVPVLIVGDDPAISGAPARPVDSRLVQGSGSGRIYRSPSHPAPQG